MQPFFFSGTTLLTTIGFSTVVPIFDRLEIRSRYFSNKSVASLTADAITCTSFSALVSKKLISISYFFFIYVNHPFICKMLAGSTPRSDFVPSKQNDKSLMVHVYPNSVIQPSSPSRSYFIFLPPIYASFPISKQRKTP